jgi:hypothetical protein
MSLLLYIDRHDCGNNLREKGDYFSIANEVEQAVSIVNDCQTRESDYAFGGTRDFK